MNKTKIEWVKNPDGTQGYTCNPVKGKCPLACPYCYARKMYDRFKWDPQIRFEVKALLDIEALKKPSGIFLGSTFELFWDGLERFWQDSIFKTIKDCPRHRFYLLTRQPQNLIKWSPFPPNCYVGVTATSFQMFAHALYRLSEIEAKIKYISLEPYLDRIIGDDNSGFYNRECLASDLKHYLDWLIIGAQTKPSVYPKLEWAAEIVQVADRAGVKVFLKDNLAPLLLNLSIHDANAGLVDSLLDNAGRLRQEMPRC